MKNFDDIICNAYTFIEFRGLFKAYSEDPRNQREDDLIHAWDVVVEDYKSLSKHMTTEAIRQAHSYIMEEL